MADLKKARNVLSKLAKDHSKRSDTEKERLSANYVQAHKDAAELLASCKTRGEWELDGDGGFFKMQHAWSMSVEFFTDDDDKLIRDSFKTVTTHCHECGFSEHKMHKTLQEALKGAEDTLILMANNLLYPLHGKIAFASDY